MADFDTTAASFVLTADSTVVTADVAPAPPAPAENVDEYLDRITSWHRGKPKFVATVRAVAQAMVDVSDVMADLPEDFDLDRAIGVQLDVVGEWIGRSRFIETPIPGLYFSFDTEGRGFDEGIWKGPYDSDTGITRLDDDTYRLLLRAKILANQWDGTNETIKEALDTIFTDGSTYLSVIDNYDMSMTIGVSGKVPSILFLAILSQGYIPLKPEGVRVNYLITSVNYAPLFGFDIENEYIGGFDKGAWGVPPEHFTS